MKGGLLVKHHDALAEIRSGKLRPVYLIYGKEPFLVEELLQEIRQAAVVPDTADFNYNVVQPGPDQLTQALGLAQTQPFFAERRLVVVRDCPFFSARRKQESEADQGEEKPAAGDDLLLAYLNRPVPFTCLVFLAGDSVDSRRKVTKAAAAAGAVVECSPLKEADAAMWAEHRALFYGKRMGSTAAANLVEKLGPNLRMVDTELQKLVLYVGDASQITPGDVDAVVGGIAETEIYRLTEAVVLKQQAQALRLLEQVLRQVDHPLQVLAALTNKFRQLLMVKALVARRVSEKEGAGLAKMHPYPYRKLAGHVRRVPREEIVDDLQKLLAADLAIKSGSDPKLTLETVIVELME